MAILGIAFLAARLKDYSEHQLLASIGPDIWIVVGALSVLYGCANSLLALGWHELLAQFGSPVSRLWSIKTYGLSQLAKYIPGNIFHLAGRQAIGMSAGVSAAALAKSSLWELALIIVAAILFGLLTVPLWVPGLPVLFCAFVLLAAAWTFIYLLRKFAAVQASNSFILYLVYLATSAAIFVILLNVTSPAVTADFTTTLLIGGAYVVAWMIGLITPGAPAGVGVRELTLLFLLKGLVVEMDLIITVILGRIVTVTGDLIFYLYAAVSKIDRDSFD